MKHIIEYLNNNFGIDNNTSATLIITLSVFILGFLLNGIIRLINRIIMRKNYRKLFFIQLNDIIKAAKIQAGNFSDLKKTLKIEHFGDYYLKTHRISSIRNFYEIPFTKYYNSFFQGILYLRNKTYIADFNKVYAAIDSLNEMESRYKNELDTFIVKHNEYKNKWNNSVENCRIYIENILLQLDGKKLQREFAEFIIEINDIYAKVSQMEITNHPNNVNEFLIKPLLEKVRDPENKEFIKNFMPLLKILVDAEFDFLNLERGISAYYTVFDIFENEYFNISKTLNEISMKLN